MPELNCIYLVPFSSFLPPLSFFTTTLLSVYESKTNNLKGGGGVDDHVICARTHKFKKNH